MSKAQEELFVDVLDQVIGDGVTCGAIFDLFMQLSEVLLGRKDLEAWLGRAYLQTLLDGAHKAQSDPKFNPHYVPQNILTVLEAFESIAASDPPNLEAAVQEQIVAARNSNAVVAKSIIALWYCAALIDLTPGEGKGFLTLTAPIQTYPSALIWQAIGGNPMGIPGTYYGNWSYPSPIPIVEPPPRDASRA